MARGPLRMGKSGCVFIRKGYRGVNTDPRLQPLRSGTALETLGHENLGDAQGDDRALALAGADLE